MPYAQQLPHIAQTLAMPPSSCGKFAASEYAMSNPNSPTNPNPSQAAPAKPEQGKDEHSPRDPKHASQGQEAKEAQPNKETQPGKQDQSNR
jgi:hypothetical protein